MKLGREHAIGAILAVLLGLGGVWLYRNTEWVEQRVPAVPSEAEQRDPQYRLKRVLTELGARVVSPESLDTLPPLGATLVLGSWHWNLFPERSIALQRWVEAGGDLVVSHDLRADGGLEWLPVKAVRLRRAAVPPRVTPKDDDDADDDDEATPPIDAPAPVPAPLGKGLRCASFFEPPSVTPAFGAPREYATWFCPTVVLQTKLPIAWALDVPQGHVVLRLPVARGTVTLTSPGMPWDNEQVFANDNALIAAAALRAAPGREIWFVSTEARLPLLELLWKRGAPAVLLGALALAFGLWRGAVRFGPQAAAAPAARRSVAEQIRGTAGFIASRGGGSALHAAQLRALEDAARLRLRGYDALGSTARAQAIAAACAMDATALARAMNPLLTPALARHPAPALALLETARRRLRNAVRPAHDAAGPAARA